jgi:hypothetical protein
MQPAMSSAAKTHLDPDAKDECNRIPTTDDVQAAFERSQAQPKRRRRRKCRKRRTPRTTPMVPMMAPAVGENCSDSDGADGGDNESHVEDQQNPSTYLPMPPSNISRKQDNFPSCYGAIFNCDLSTKLFPNQLSPQGVLAVLAESRLWLWRPTVGFTVPPQKLGSARLFPPVFGN